MHKFDFLNILSQAEKKKIIDHKAQKYYNHGYYASFSECVKRANNEMMPTRKYKLFSKITQCICAFYSLNTTSENISISTNRNGKHSWYISLYGDVCIRISDHYAYTDYSEISILINKIGKGCIIYVCKGSDYKITSFKNLIKFIKSEATKFMISNITLYRDGVLERFAETEY